MSGSTYCVDIPEISGNAGVINATRVTATKCHYGFYVGRGGSNKTTASDSISSDNVIVFYAGSASSRFVSLGNNTVVGNTTNITGVIIPFAVQ